MNDRRGITLLELLAVITIAAILILVSVPLYTSFTSNYRLASAAEELRNALELARSEAIKQNTTVYVNFGTGDTWCYGLKAGSTCDCTVANNCTLKTVSYTTAQQLTLSTAGMSGNTINFEGSHGAASASGSATFTLYGQSTLITLNIGRLGGIQLCSTGLSGYTAC